MSGLAEHLLDLANSFNSDQKRKDQANLELCISDLEALCEDAAKRGFLSYTLHERALHTRGVGLKTLSEAFQKEHQDLQVEYFAGTIGRLRNPSASPKIVIRWGERQ